MSELVTIRTTRAFVVEKAGGAKRHFIAGGDYRVAPDLAFEMVASGGAEDVDGVLDIPTEPEPEDETEAPEFERPAALEPQDTGDLSAEED